MIGIANTVNDDRLDNSSVSSISSSSIRVDASLVAESDLRSDSSPSTLLKTFWTAFRRSSCRSAFTNDDDAAATADENQIVKIGIGDRQIWKERRREIDTEIQTQRDEQGAAFLSRKAADAHPINTRFSFFGGIYRKKKENKNTSQPEGQKINTILNNKFLPMTSKSW